MININERNNILSICERESNSKESRNKIKKKKKEHIVTIIFYK